jgi:hypothetical protein
LREVRHTFEHLVVILGVFFLCLAIIFAIPAVRVWAFQNVPGAVVGVAGTGPMANVMGGVDPQLLSEAINDDETREELIELWKESVPEMDPQALAEMGNELLADPNTAALLVDLIAEVDPAAMSELYNSLLADPVVADHLIALLPLLDTQGLANLTNAIMASPGTADLVKGIIENSDSEATAKLVNAVISDDDTVDTVAELIGYIDAAEVAALTNAVLADESAFQSITDLTSTLMDTLDPEGVAALTHKTLINTRPELDEEGNPVVDEDGNPVVVYVAVEQIDQLLEALVFDDLATDADESSPLFMFTWNLLDPEQNPESVTFIMNILANIRPEFDEEGNPDDDCILAVLNRLFTPGQSLHQALIGQNGVNDALMDFFFLEAKLHYVWPRGYSDVEFIYQNVEQWLNMIPNTVRMWVTGILGDTDYANDLANDLIANFFNDEFAEYAGGWYSGLYTAGLYDFAYYGRFPDLAFSEIPPWMKDNSYNWPEDFVFSDGSGPDPGTFHDPAWHLPDFWRD